MKRKISKIGLYFVIIIITIVALNIQVIDSRQLIFDNNSNDCMVESTDELRNIMLTGYWNPTGQMIAQFSNDSYLNPAGWKGGNWEGWGFDIYSFFPTPGIYNGTFEVDYQDTWEDFWTITQEINPIAIISFGAGAGPWEIEFNARNLNSWVPDNNPPYQPTPCPPDDTKPAGYVRHSTLPVQSIADAVNNQTTVHAWVDWTGDPGAYLCEYMAYLGMWYQDIHNTTNDTYPCWSSGFIHVAASTPLQDAIQATEITLREVIKYLLNLNSPPDSPNIDGVTYGYVGEEYNYTISAFDPQDENVSYYVEWGDGDIEDWFGPFESGKEITLSHIWQEEGEYCIKIKAKDINDLESPWEILNVTIVPIIDVGVITGGLFKVAATLSNIGEIDATNVNWNIKLDGGAFIGKDKSGTDNILSGEDLIINSNFILGFGSTTITVEAEFNDYSNTRKQSGFVFLFFVQVNPGG
jgi:hypothetical protein